jgi:hypothetical protein
MKERLRERDREIDTERERAGDLIATQQSPKSFRGQGRVRRERDCNST